MRALFLRRRLKTAGLLALVYLAAFYWYARCQHISGPRFSSIRLLHSSFLFIETKVATSTVLAPSPTHHSTAVASSVDHAQHTPPASTAAIERYQPYPIPPTAAIVAAVNLETNLSWIHEVNNSMWKLHRYNFNDPTPPAKTWFPANKGNEAMMYLSYIITHYNALPDYSLFIHGHLKSWHQQADMVSLINNLRISALDKHGYVPLRCDWYPSCPAEMRPIDHDATVWGPGVYREAAEWAIGDAWEELFGHVEELPATIASPCCAQFVVTREAIQRRSRSEFERMRAWLQRTALGDEISGRVFEKLWAYIMTGDAVRCPPPPQCACQYFGQCAPRQWPVPIDGLDSWEENRTFVSQASSRNNGGNASASTEVYASAGKGVNASPSQGVQANSIRGA